ncbi:hypothetical protein [Serratia microhaemolytica]|nr:hypothetical protein [Serratia microhaemolytica]
MIIVLENSLTPCYQGAFQLLINWQQAAKPLATLSGEGYGTFY